MASKDTHHSELVPRVRFAPSPTGYLHIGGLRTALFNWLFARHNNGLFLLRIEDTDRERSLLKYQEALLDDLAWSGLVSDEPLVIQSERTELYKQRAQELLDQQKAYRCYCSIDELEQRRAELDESESIRQYDNTCRIAEENVACNERETRPYVVRFRVPENLQEVSFCDAIRGLVTVNRDQLDDFIIIRSDGTPTYNFAVVIDDSDMNITHVIRAEEHIANTPKQILLYQAFGLSHPVFAHVPMILGPDGHKLSKRTGATSVGDYRRAGFLAPALRTYLARLSWSHGDQEIFTDQELIQYFSLEGIGKKPAIFDSKKLEWVNSIYLHQTDPEELLTLIITDVDPDFCQNFSGISNQQLISYIRLYRERSKTLRELRDQILELYQGPVALDFTSFPEYRVILRTYLPKFIEYIEALDIITPEAAKQVLDELCKKESLKLPDLAKPLRYSLTGQVSTPGIFDMLAVLGKQEVLNRLEKAYGTVTQIS